MKETPSDPEAETQHKTGSAAGSTDLGKPVVPRLRKLTISGNISPIMPLRTRSR